MIEHFHRPTSLEEGLKLKENEGAVYLAGGTQLNSEKRDDIKSVISLENIVSSEIAEKEGYLRIGAMATIQSIIDFTFKNSKFEILKKACLNISNRNIRNMATIGGNIGANKSSSDLLPLLMVMDAYLKLPDGGVSVREYVEKKMDSLILLVGIPTPSENQYFSIRKFTRTVSDIAIINLALSLKVSENKIKEAYIAGGSLAPHVVFFQKTSDALGGISFDEVEERIDNYKEDISPIDDIRASAWFREEITGVYLKEMIEEIRGDL